MLHPILQKVFYIPFLPALMWAGIIFWGSTINGIRVPFPEQDLLEPDKLVHALAYTGLGFLTLMGVHLHKKIKTSSRNLILALILCLNFGVGLELVQGLLIPERQFEYLDMLANAAGLILGWLAYYLFIT